MTNEMEKVQKETTRLHLGYARLVSAKLKMARNYEEQIQDLQTEIADYEASLTEVVDDVVLMHNQIQDLQKEIADYKTSLTEVVDDSIMMHNQIQDLQKANDALQTKNEGLEIEANQLLATMNLAMSQDTLFDADKILRGYIEDSKEKYVHF